MPWLAKNFVGGLLLPPCNLLIAQAAGLFLWKRRPGLSRALITGSFVGFVLLCMPATAVLLVQGLERGLPPVDLNDPKLPQLADAIVVLGGGRSYNSQEYGGHDAVSSAGLTRVRYAVDLRRKTGKPVLLTGGAPAGGGPSEAALMGEAMQEEFGVKADWLEQRSENTAENAEFSYRILSAAGIRRVFLVTHGWHMPRAYRSFKKAGFSVVPAPMGFLSDEGPGSQVLALLPNAKGMEMSYDAFHEGIGEIWYRIRGDE